MGCECGAQLPTAVIASQRVAMTKKLTTRGERKLSGPVQRIIESNGIRLNIAEQGEGPPVILCHGFPESWYSWRHQLTALADAGFHAVAPDMRGYGKSDRPEA